MQNIGLKTTKVEKLTDDTIFILPTLTTHSWPLEICYDFNAYGHGNNLKIIIKNCQMESWSELCIYSTRLSMVCYARKYSLPLTIISNRARSSSACEIDWNFSRPHAWPLHNEAVIATKGGPTHLKMIQFITKIVFYFHFLSTHSNPSRAPQDVTFKATQFGFIYIAPVHSKFNLKALYRNNFNSVTHTFQLVRVIKQYSKLG